MFLNHRMIDTHIKMWGRKDDYWCKFQNYPAIMQPHNYKFAIIAVEA